MAPLAYFHNFAFHSKLYLFGFSSWVLLRLQHHDVLKSLFWDSKATGNVDVQLRTQLNHTAKALKTAPGADVHVCVCVCFSMFAATAR